MARVVTYYASTPSGSPAWYTQAGWYLKIDQGTPSLLGSQNSRLAGNETIVFNSDTPALGEFSALGGTDTYKFELGFDQDITINDQSAGTGEKNLIQFATGFKAAKVAKITGPGGTARLEITISDSDDTDLSDNKTITVKALSITEFQVGNNTYTADAFVATYPTGFTAGAMNTPPVLADITAIDIADTSADDTPAASTGTFTATDADSGDTITFSVTGATAEANTKGGVDYTHKLAGTYGTLYYNDGNGKYRYEPNATAINALAASASMKDEFTVMANDGSLDSISKKLVVNVTGANDAPGATSAKSGTVNEGATLALSNGELLTADVDDAASGLTYTLLTLPANGKLQKWTDANNDGTKDASEWADLAANGTFTQADVNGGAVRYVHDGSETTSDSFTFTVDDGNEDNSAPTTQTFSLTITPVNDAPSIAHQVLAYNDDATEIILDTTHLLATDPDDTQDNITFTLKSLPAAAAGKIQILGDHDNDANTDDTWADAAIDDTFTGADLAAGKIKFVVGNTGGDTSFTFTIKDDSAGTESAALTFTIDERGTHTVGTPDNDNSIDLSSETEGKIVDAGDGKDTIIGGQGNDQITGGLGDDDIDLGADGGSDEVVYGLGTGTNWTATDGGDTVKNFKRGQDKLTLKVGASETTYTDLEKFLLGADGADDTPLTADDQFIVTPDWVSDGGSFYVTGITFHFREAGTYGNNKIASGLFHIDFAARMTWDDFVTTIGGASNFDGGRGAIKKLVEVDPNDATKVTKNYIAELLGQDSIDFSKAAPTPDNTAPAFSSEDKAGTLDEQTASSDTDTGLSFTASDETATLTASDFTVYEKSGGSYSGTASTRFKVVADTGANNWKIVLISGQSIDHETASSIELRVTASDGTNTADSDDYTLTVNDLNDSDPSITSSATGTALPENTEVDTSTAVYTAAGTSDAGDNIVWSLKAGVGDVALFDIDDSTGEVTFDAATTPNYEDKSSYSFTIVATVIADGNTHTAEQAVTISVTNLDEAGSIAAISGTTTVGQDLTAGTVTDPDGTVSGQTYQWQSASTSDGTYTDISGATSSTYTLAGTDVGKFLKVVVTYTDPQGSGKTVTSAATSAAVAAANNAPTVANALIDQSGTAGTAGTYAFAANSFNDADGDTLTYTASVASSDTDNDATGETALTTTANSDGLTFDASTRTIGWGTSTSAGDYYVRITASDGTASISDIVKITIGSSTPSTLITEDDYTLAEGTNTTGDTIDKSAATGAQLIKGGHKADTITGSNHGDVIAGGFGSDTINLGTGDDVVVYRFDQTGKAADGGDTINNFKLGADKFYFVNARDTGSNSSVNTKTEWWNDFYGTTTTKTSPADANDDYFVVQLKLEGDNYNELTGLTITFNQGSWKDQGENTGDPSSAVVNINFHEDSHFKVFNDGFTEYTAAGANLFNGISAGDAYTGSSTLWDDNSFQLYDVRYTWDKIFGDSYYDVTDETGLGTTVDIA